ncbi:MAG: hypothetical protein JWR07_1908 [Nevskia sp.]|nr:hypothetical protein [Nevskia sp.]
MAITKVHVPDHFLVRWNENTGLLQGAQVGYIEKIVEDGVVISIKEGDPMAVALGLAAGFPLSSVLGEINTALLADADTKTAQIAQLTTDKVASDKAAADALAQVATLTAQLADYTSPKDVAGVPEWVYKSQAYKALITAGKMDSLVAALAAAASKDLAGKLAQVDFETSARFFRKHPTVQMFVDSGLFTDAEVDGLFKLAATFAV